MSGLRLQPWTVSWRKKNKGDVFFKPLRRSIENKTKASPNMIMTEIANSYVSPSSMMKWSRASLPWSSMLPNGWTIKEQKIQWHTCYTSKKLWLQWVLIETREIAWCISFLQLLYVMEHRNGSRIWYLTPSPPSHNSKNVHH